MLPTRNAVVVVTAAVLITCAASIAWLLQPHWFVSDWRVFTSALPLLILFRLIALGRSDLLHARGLRPDILQLLRDVSLGSVGFLLMERGIIGDMRLPLSFHLSEAILTLTALFAIRELAWRVRSKSRTRAANGMKTVVIIGAGRAAEMLLRELSRDCYLPVALVDDDPKKAGRRIHQVPVAGALSDLPAVVEDYAPDELMIAIPSATDDQMSRIVKQCDRSGVRFRTVPRRADRIDTITVDQLRDVRCEELLGRDPINLNVDSVRQRIAGRVVMVTGAAGSIGAELCRQLAHYQPEKIVCLDQAETPLFYLQQSDFAASCSTAFCVADIKDRNRMRDIIHEHDVRVIFHAAAYKHVPMMEENVPEALANNVFGLLALLETAEESGCEDFLFISSDKAVDPSSIMGCTKRLGELIVAARPSRMRSLSVRFGNVLGSQGSVIPLFQQQMKNGRQITVTDPEIARFFMTIPEAVSLVLQAFSIGQMRDILVLDMGDPVRILDLAKTLIRLSGFSQQEIDIVFTGLRSGEKMSEKLFYSFEKRVDTGIAKVFGTQAQFVPWGGLQAQLTELRSENDTAIPDRIRTKVKEIIPQYEWKPESLPLRVAAQAAPVMKISGEQPACVRGLD